jgi:hypothetical protein
MEKRTKQIPHPQLHILNQSAHIRDVAGIRLNRQISLHLPGHVPTQVHLAEPLILVGEVQDNRAGELVV